MMKTIRKILSVLLMVMLFVSVAAPQSFAASKTKKMKTYRTIVKGKYAYCTTYKGIYRVNIKTGKKKLLVKENGALNGWKYTNLKLYKGYLYFTEDRDDNYNHVLYRVKTSGKSRKELGAVKSYAISDGKIYYTMMKDEDPDDDLGPGNIVKKQMKLNGKNKKKSKYDVKMTLKKTNKKGYYVRKDLIEYDNEEGWEEYGDWLMLGWDKSKVDIEDAPCRLLCKYYEYLPYDDYYEGAE